MRENEQSDLQQFHGEDPHKLGHFGHTDPPVQVDGTGLTIADIDRIANGAGVRLAPEALDRIRRQHRQAREISERQPVYGQSTGVGANRFVQIDEQDGDHGLRLLRSHAADAGSGVPAETVRVMLAIRLSQLAASGSGISPDIVQGLERMLRDDALPTIRTVGGIGTADLAALASTALALHGERPTTRPLAATVPFGRDSALPFMSSSALTLARAARSLARLRELERSSRVVAALSATAVRANRQAFSPQAGRAAVIPAATRVAEEMRELLEDESEPARIQDPFGLRAYIQSQGAVVEAMDRLLNLVEPLTSVAQENPLFDFESQSAVHHGGFHQVSLGLAIDGLDLALAQSAPLVMSRITMLHDPAYTGTPSFLADGTDGSSGHMMLEYIAASAMAQLRNAAQPASMNTVVLSQGAEEDASFATQAVDQLERAADNYQMMLSIELLSAHRAIDLLGRTTSTPLNRAILHMREAVPVVAADHDLRPDIDSASRALTGLARRILHEA
ncbi:aromatic amino acid ammonia-lyase [Rothia uropygialis]|uniref:aromatic amino acid ammonia-lyase n=1 Tax=Kocuria sp. 36 TaxID=1415402 RepID=UPI00101B6A7A|nr:aromatic amino acid ammonia-lyase [Kocuria sp. 36]